MGGDFDKTPIRAFVVAEIPFVFVIEVVAYFVGGLTVGGVGFAFDDDDAFGVGQGEGDILVADEVGVFLGVGAGGDIDFAADPDKPDGGEMRPRITTHCCYPDRCFPAQPGIYGSPAFRVSTHRSRGLYFTAWGWGNAAARRRLKLTAHMKNLLKQDHPTLLMLTLVKCSNTCLSKCGFVWLKCSVNSLNCFVTMYQMPFSISWTFQ